MHSALNSHQIWELRKLISHVLLQRKRQRRAHRFHGLASNFLFILYYTHIYKDCTVRIIQRFVYALIQTVTLCSTPRHRHFHSPQKQTKQKVYEIFICQWVKKDTYAPGNNFRPDELLSGIVRCCRCCCIHKDAPPQWICSFQSQLQFISITKVAKEENITRIPISYYSLRFDGHTVEQDTVQ